MRSGWQVAICVFAGGCAGRVPSPTSSPAPPTVFHAESQVITPGGGGGERELMSRGESALAQQKWAEAIDAFELLVAAGRIDDALARDAARILYDLGLAYEGAGQREKASARYHELARRFPATAEARAGLVRVLEVHAYLEQWPELGETSKTLLSRADIDPIDRLTALGGRGLSEVELGADGDAMRDVQAGLDLVDELHYGAENRLPVAAAQLRFALAEIRRLRSERIVLLPVTPDFLLKIEARCQGLLDAQNTYADAIRSVDPHWAAMSGYRIGEMYRDLHRDLMLIPPTSQAKTEKQKQLFFAMMHLRYRVLLEKGLEMMRRTLALGQRIGDDSSWLLRARRAEADMEVALVDEKATLAKFPYGEEELRKALDVLQKKAEASPPPTP